MYFICIYLWIYMFACVYISCCFKVQKRTSSKQSFLRTPCSASNSEFTSDRKVGNFFPWHKGNIIVWLSSHSSIDALRCGADEDHPGNPAAATVSESPPTVCWNPTRLSQKQEKLDSDLAAVANLILARTRKRLTYPLHDQKGNAKVFFSAEFGQIVCGPAPNHFLESIK